MKPLFVLQVFLQIDFFSPYEGAPYRTGCSDELQPRLDVERSRNSVKERQSHVRMISRLQPCNGWLGSSNQLRQLGLSEVPSHAHSDNLSCQIIFCR